MSNLSAQTHDNLYKVIKKLAFDYRVDAYHIENLLRVAIDKKQLKPVNYSFNQLLDIWYRDCQFSLDDHFCDIGIAA